MSRSASAVPSARADMLATLAERLGPTAVMTETDILERHSRDTSRLGPVRPIAVVRPSDTEGVSTLMRIASAHDVPVVPQGGLTGLCGGAVPVDGSIALSLERMAGVEAIDRDTTSMTVRAGTPLQVVQEAAKDGGYFYPVDIGSRGSCTIGGNIATNAGGVRVVRYGMTRDMVLGLEVVLADGTVVSSLNRLLKNNAGYDLKHIFIGSEGTLGIVTRAVLRLFAKPAWTGMALCVVPDFAALLTLLAAARDGLGPHLSAFEAMWPHYWRMATERVAGARNPFPGRTGLFVLIEVQGFGPEDDGDRLASWLERLFVSGTVSDALVAQSLSDMNDFWAIRDANSEFGSIYGACISFDIGLPAARIGSFVEGVKASMLQGAPDSETFFFGHIGDGNIHVMATAPGGYESSAPAVEAAVYRQARLAGGTVSAEHGIGLLKKPWLADTRSSAEIDLMWGIKRSLDPKNLLNPQKVLPSCAAWPPQPPR